VEVVQAFALEPRAAEYVDVVANTLGGLIGALVSIPLAAWLRRVSDERSG
jgi:VanZ family protein